MKCTHIVYKNKSVIAQIQKKIYATLPYSAQRTLYPLYYICVFYHRNTEAASITAVPIRTLV